MEATTGQRRIVFDDQITRMFIGASVVFGLVAMLVGLLIASQLAWWQMNLGLPYTVFSRLRPLHTNAVIFAFVGNMMFAGIYYSTQRLLKARMASDLLSQDPLLGLAAHHRLRRHHAARSASPRQGVRRAGVADRHR